VIHGINRVLVPNTNLANAGMQSRNAGMGGNSQLSGGGQQ
jgi:hypothetical protein